MQKLILTSLFLVAALTGFSVSAATLYKWIDQDGNVVYQDTPPPNDVQFEESEVEGVPIPLSDAVGLQIEEAALVNPVSLYTVAVCDSCDLVRLYLEKSSIPFVEKDVRSNIETQAELEALTGALSVPTLVIGDKVIDGFSRSAIKSALTDAGFPMDVPPADASPASEVAADQTAETETDQVTEPEQEIDPDEELQESEDPAGSDELESAEFSTDS